MSIPCFFIEPTGRAKIFLRRYRSAPSDDPKKCPGKYSYHNAMVYVIEMEERKTPEGYIESIPEDFYAQYADDPRWPAKCDHCDYLFDPADKNDKDQIFQQSIWRRTDNGQVAVLEEMPAGAIWNAWWMRNAGPDGKYLLCRMPGGHDWGTRSDNMRDLVSKGRFIAHNKYIQFCKRGHPRFGPGSETRVRITPSGYEERMCVRCKREYDAMRRGHNAGIGKEKE